MWVCVYVCVCMWVRYDLLDVFESYPINVSLEVLLTIFKNMANLLR